MKTMTAAIISMAATAMVWANTAEAVFRVASFMALPLCLFASRRIEICRLEFRSRVIVAASGAMTPRFLRRTPQDCIRRHMSPCDEYNPGRLDHQCGGNLSRAVMTVAGRHATLPHTA
ncbi:MAG: hypothetical protein J0H40_02750 [Rhizobiales bacterium]|nr:hypothetical protein [Hyphomicrobiales bacterium]